MTKEVPIPTTVGKLIDLLSKYPEDAELDVSIVEIYDNGSVYPTDSYRMRVKDYEFGGVSITFANGRTLDNDA